MKRFASLLILLVCSLCQAANEIRAFDPGATTCYTVVREIDGDVWYIAGDTFEAWGTSGRAAADYDIALTDKTGGFFVGTMDTDIGAGYYYLVTHQQAAASPADTDPAVFQEYGYWSGTVWQPNTLKTIEDKADIIAVDVDGLDGDAMASGFNTVVPDVAGTAAGLHATTDGLIGGLVVPDVAGTASTLHTATNLLITTLDTVADTIAIDVAGLDGDAMASGFNTVVPDVAGTAAGLHATTDGLIGGLNDITVAEIMAATIEGSITFVKAMRGLVAMGLGKADGGGTTTVNFRNSGDTKNVISATVDENGNRTAMTLDLD